jgi:Dyp-type peroxidase family
MADERLDIEDIQGIVLRAYGDLRHAAYLFLHVEDPGRARSWLRDLYGEITRACDVVDKGKVRGVQRMNVAFSVPGLEALGMDEDALTSFPDELREGMVERDRSRVLGDVGESAPEHWHFGASPEVDVVLFLYAGGEEDLRRLAKRELERLRGVQLMHIEYTTPLPGAKEHFGFTDGIAQPGVRGDPFREKIPGQDAVAAGEFVLGYQNDYEQLPWTPTVAGSSHARAAGLKLCRADGRHDDSHRRFDLGQNGTYLVLRKLEQDVDGFWSYFRARAAEIAAPAEIGDVATWLASKCVGRWPSGAPLVLSPHHDDPAAAHPQRRDDFRYADDPEGLRCPFGAHIRRSNPRDSKDRAGNTSISEVSPRRILRRGRTYISDDGKRGVLFLAICANVRRQFEFVQQTWLGNRRFATLDQDPDPIVGGGRPGDGFTVPAHPYRYRLKELPRFVTVRGGGYFFMPGMRALRYLGEDPI